MISSNGYDYDVDQRFDILCASKSMFVSFLWWKEGTNVF